MTPADVIAMDGGTVACGSMCWNRCSFNFNFTRAALAPAPGFAGAQTLDEHVRGGTAPSWRLVRGFVKQLLKEWKCVVWQFGLFINPPFL